MIKIIGRNNSIAVQKVLWTASELKLPFHRENMGGSFGFTKDYTKLNPNNRIPTLIDSDGFVLWESHAIIRYLCQKYENKIFPTDIKSQAQINKWMDWQITTLYPPLRTIFFNLIRYPPEKRDMVAVDKASLECKELWKIIEDELSLKPYVLGSEFTLADIPLAITAHRWIRLNGREKNFPYMHSWYDNLVETRPLFRQLVVDLELN